MSNCYDHEYKANMLDSYYWDNKVEAKKNLSKNLNKLTDWYKAEQKKYERARFSAHKAQPNERKRKNKKS